MIPGIIASSYFAASGAFESIASAAGTGSSGTITFSSIPSTYQHLQIRFVGKTTTNDSNVRLFIRLNGNTGSNYARHSLNGDGASVSAAGGSSQTSMVLSLTGGGTIIGSLPANVVGAGIIDIHDYASTTKNTTIRAFSGVDTNNDANATGLINLDSGLFNDTSAINSITLYVDGLNFATTTQFALYGIKGA